MSKIAPDHLSRQAFVYVRHPRETDSGTTKRAGVGVGSTGSPTALAGWVGLYEEWACDRWGSRTRPWLSTGTAQRSTDGCSRWAPNSSSGACGALTVAAPDRRPSRLPVLAGHRRPDPGLVGRVVGPRRRDHPSNRTRHPVRALHLLVFDVAPKVNPCCQLSLRASSASTPSSAARSRPALPLSSPGAYASPASCSMPSARSPPSPRPGSSAVGGDRWPPVRASRWRSAPCSARCPALAERLPSPKPGSPAVGAARRPPVRASHWRSAPCPGRCPARAEGNRYRSAPSPATPRLRLAWPP